VPVTCEAWMTTSQPCVASSYRCRSSLRTRCVCVCVWRCELLRIGVGLACALGVCACVWRCELVREFRYYVLFRQWDPIGKSWATHKCHFFMWLVAHNMCWTADRLARRDLIHHPRCPHCDQAEEIIHHLLVTSVFA
jgi:hypothetical protein